MSSTMIQRCTLSLLVLYMSNSALASGAIQLATEERQRPSALRISAGFDFADQIAPHNVDYDCDTKNPLEPTEHLISRIEWSESVTLSQRPRIYYFDNFLESFSADKLAAFATEQINLQPPPLRPISHGLYKMPYNERKHMRTVSTIQDRVIDITKLTRENLEPLEILRFLSPKPTSNEYLKPARTSSKIDAPQRIATVLVFLSEPEQGGEVVFPLVLANAHERPGLDDVTMNMIESLAVQSFEDVCANPNNTVIRIRPKKGAAILIYGSKPSGQEEILSLHGFCAVQMGVSVVARQYLNVGMNNVLDIPELLAMWKLHRLQPSTYELAEETGKASVLRLEKKSKSSVQRGQKIATDSVGKFCAPIDLSSLTISRSFTITFLVKVRTCHHDGKTSAIVIKTQQGVECCTWIIRILSNCKIDLIGPDRQTRNHMQSPSLKIHSGEWQHVALVVNNGDTSLSYVQKAPPPARPVMRGRPSAPVPVEIIEEEEPDEYLFETDSDSDKENPDPLQKDGNAASEDQTSEEEIEDSSNKRHSVWTFTPNLALDVEEWSSIQGVQHVADEDTTWNNATLCLDKHRGIELSQLYIFSRVLDEEELLWLRKTSIEDAITETSASRDRTRLGG